MAELSTLSVTNVQDLDTLQAIDNAIYERMDAVGLARPAAGTALSLTVAGTNIQSHEYWSVRQDVLADIVNAQTNAVWYNPGAITATMPDPDNGVINIFADHGEFWNAAMGGHGGPRRFVPTGIGTYAVGYGLCAAGDFIGLHLIQDLITSLRWLRWPMMIANPSLHVLRADFNTSNIAYQNRVTQVAAWPESLSQAYTFDTALSQYNNYKNSVVAGQAQEWEDNSDWASAFNDEYSTYPTAAQYPPDSSMHARLSDPAHHCNAFNSLGYYWQSYIAYVDNDHNLIAEMQDFTYRFGATPAVQFKARIYAVTGDMYAPTPPSTTTTTLSPFAATVVRNGPNYPLSFRRRHLNSGSTTMADGKLIKLADTSASAYTAAHTVLTDTSNLVTTQSTNYDTTNSIRSGPTYLYMTGYGVNGVVALFQLNWAWA